MNEKLDFKSKSSLLIKLDKSTIGQSIEENENEVLLTDNNNLEIEYQKFIENCQNIDKEIDKPVVQQFVFLFSQSNSLSFEPIINTKFIESVLSKLLNSSTSIDTILLLQTLKILIPNVNFSSNILMYNITPFLFSIINAENDEIVELSLDCVLLLSNENIINRLLIECYKQVNQMQADEYIHELHTIFSRFLPNYRNERSFHICKTIIQIYGTFYPIIEQEIIKLVFNKLRAILLNSRIYSFFAIENIEKISTFNRSNLEGVAECQAIISIQEFLVNSQLEYQSQMNEMTKFINELKTLDIEKVEAIQYLSNFDVQNFSASNFFNFLESEIQDEQYLSSFTEINNKIDEIIRSQVISMNILSTFAENLLFKDLNPSLMIKLINNFNYKRNDDLSINTLKFIRQAVKGFYSFSTLYLNDPSSFQLLIHFSSLNAYLVRVEDGYLITQLIRNADKSYISKLIDANIIHCTIKLIDEMQDPQLFGELAMAICKLIDLGFGKAILPDLLEAVGSIEEMENDAFNEKAAASACMLKRKIQKIMN